MSKLGRALLGNCLLLDAVAQDQAGAEASFAAQYGDRASPEQQVAAVQRGSSRATQSATRTPPTTPARGVGAGEDSLSERVTGILPESLKIALHTRERDAGGVVDDYGDLHRALSPMDTARGSSSSKHHLPGVHAGKRA